LLIGWLKDVLVGTVVPIPSPDKPGVAEIAAAS
jgi:hypothetical protein